MAFRNCVVDRPTAASFTGSGTISNVRTLPPSALTSATPGTERRAGRITQSSKLRRSSSDISLDSTVNMNISPSGVVIGAMPPLMPLGRSALMLDSRSATC